MYHVILAGGVGSRFWPLSREKKPKQFLNLIDNESLIYLTYKRLLKISTPNKIIVLTSKKYKHNIKEQLPEIPPENILCEPSPKNTAPAIYLACKYIYNLDKNAIIGIYPSDHYIKNEDEFINTVNLVKNFIENKKDSIITIGISPSSPSTSYGYINVGESNTKLNNIYKVKKFIEKPNISKANKLIKDNSNFWNSGMFFFNIETMIFEINNFIPEIEQLYAKIDSLTDLDKIWDDMPKDSIDYAIMEKTDKSYCIKSSFGWSDLGTWLALYHQLDKDKNNNVFQGKVLAYNSSNNLIISKKRLTSIVGLENVAIINLEDTTLVIDLDKSEEVRHIVDQLDKPLK